MIENISALELKLILDSSPPEVLLLDVREPHEYEYCHLGGYLIPLAELEARIDELDKDKIIIVYCRSGYRSQIAINILQQANFNHLRHFAGGILGWAKDVDPNFPVY